MTRRRAFCSSGRTRYELPLADWLAKKWDAVEERARLPRPGGGDRRQRTVRRALPACAARQARRARRRSLFYLRLPLRVRHQIQDVRARRDHRLRPLRRRRRSRGQEAREQSHARDRRGARRLADVHALLRLAARGGSWRASSTGSPSGPCGAPTRRARSRPSPSELVEEVRGEPPTVTFTAYSDLSAFTERPVAPLPEQPDADLRRRARGATRTSRDWRARGACWRLGFPRRGW